MRSQVIYEVRTAGCSTALDGCQCWVGYSSGCWTALDGYQHWKYFCLRSRKPVLASAPALKITKVRPVTDDAGLSGDLRACVGRAALAGRGVAAPGGRGAAVMEGPG